MNFITKPIPLGQLVESRVQEKSIFVLEKREEIIIIQNFYFGPA